MSAVSAVSPFQVYLAFPRTCGDGLRDRAAATTLLSRVLGYPGRAETPVRRRLALVVRSDER